MFSRCARRAVDSQEPDPASVLNTTRAFLNWRRERLPLRIGSIRFRRDRGSVLAFERADTADRLLCLFNLGDAEQLWPAAEPILDAGFMSEGASIQGRKVRLPAWGFAFAHLE